MREVFGSTWIMQLMFGFTFLFICFLAVTISYSKAFRIKNEAISIIEKYGGYTNSSRDIINKYINNNGYRAKGRCPYDNKLNKKQYGIKDLAGNYEEITAATNKTYRYCISRDWAGDKQVSNVIYEVTMFYKFDLPIIGNATTFTVKGKTTDLVKRIDLFD